MPDNKISSSNNYTVGNVTSINTDNNIFKRPYTNTPFSSNKKQHESDSFDDTMDSLVSHSHSNENSEDFSNLLINELNNISRLKNSESSRVIKANFETSSSKNTTSLNKSESGHELHSKIADAQNLEVDTSTLCKKIELLNSLKRDSNN